MPSTSRSRKAAKNNISTRSGGGSAAKAVVSTGRTTSKQNPKNKTPPRVAVTSPRKKDFVPTCLPDGGGEIPDHILRRYNESLTVGAITDFTLLSEEQHLMWLDFFSKSTARLNGVCLSQQQQIVSLQGQLTEYRNASTAEIDGKEKMKFVDSILPLIKSEMFKIFIRLIFASRLEVTTSRDKNSLINFGLTEKSALATLVFYQVFNTQLGIRSQPIDLDGGDASDLHPFDTPEGRVSLWFDCGIGAFSMKQFNKIRNTYTNQIREVTSKCSCILLYVCVVVILHIFLVCIIHCRGSVSQASHELSSI